MNLVSGVYKIENLKNGKCYIGSSVDIKKRLYNHKRELSKNIHCNVRLQNAWNKYGEDAFSLSPVVYCEVINLIVYEQLIIDGFDSVNNGYNICSTAGNCLGRKLSEESLRKISESRKGKGGRPGVSPSEETKAKLRAANLGKRASEETKKKMSESMKGKNVGKKLTDEHKKFLANLLLGKPRPRTLEHQLKLNESLRGKPRSEETKKKLSEANRGKKHTEETKQKMRESHKKRLELEKQKQAA